MSLEVDTPSFLLSLIMLYKWTPCSSTVSSYCFHWEGTQAYSHTWLNRHLARSFRVASGLKGRSNFEPSGEQRKANDGRKCSGQLGLKQTRTVNYHFTHMLLKYKLFLCFSPFSWIVRLPLQQSLTDELYRKTFQHTSDSSNREEEHTFAFPLLCRGAVAIATASLYPMERFPRLPLSQ